MLKKEYRVLTIPEAEKVTNDLSFGYYDIVTRADIFKASYTMYNAVSNELLLKQRQLLVDLLDNVDALDTEKLKKDLLKVQTADLSPEVFIRLYAEALI